MVVPDYRRYPEVLFPQMMYDSAAAVAWVNDNIARFGGEPDQIFLMGHSSGGHLAVMLTVNERYLGAELHRNIRGFIGLAAPYDFVFDRPYLPKVFAGLDYAESQPSQFVDGSEPPLLLLYGNEDSSRLFAQYRQYDKNRAGKRWGNRITYLRRRRSRRYSWCLFHSLS